jgi:hypothetical protein
MLLLVQKKKLLLPVLFLMLRLLLLLLLYHPCSCTQFAAVSTVCPACSADRDAAPASDACCLPKHAALIGAFLHLLPLLLPAALEAVEGPPSGAQTEPLL